MLCNTHLTRPNKIKSNQDDFHNVLPFVHLDENNFSSIGVKEPWESPIHYYCAHGGYYHMLPMQEHNVIHLMLTKDALLYHNARGHWKDHTNQLILGELQNRGTGPMKVVSQPMNL